VMRFFFTDIKETTLHLSIALKRRKRKFHHKFFKIF
jgi:hypothetical protein